MKKGGTVSAVLPIPSLPDSVYYVPEFITEAEEAILLQKVH